MSHITSPTSSFCELLLQFDMDTARRLRCLGCQFCGGVLDRADYSRKYRGGSGDEVPGFDRRFSLCCRREGCRRRVAAESVRFLGRKVYLAFMVILASSTATEKSLSELARDSAVSRQTLARWLAFWRLRVPASAAWKGIQAMFVPPLALSDLPGELRRAFKCADLNSANWIFLLRCVAPLAAIT